MLLRRRDARARRQRTFPRRLKAIAAEKGYRLIPGHDPDVRPAFTEEMGCSGPEHEGRFLPGPFSERAAAG